jgi:hypothetical protein
MRAIVVAHTRPLISPYPLAAGAFIEVEKPGHASLLGSQTVITTRHEINKSAVAQILKLLTYLRLDVQVAGIEIAEMPFESIDLVEREVALPKRFHTFHDVEQPAARFRRFVPEKKGSLPFCKDKLLGANEAVVHDMNLAGFRDAAEQDIRPDPARAPRGGGERPSFLDDFADEKMFRHNEQINDRERLEVVIHQEQVWVVAGSQTLAFRLKCTVDNPRSEFAFLAFEFDLLLAGGAEEIGEGTVVGERRNVGLAAMRAVRPHLHPSFAPHPRALRAAGVRGLRFLETQFHNASVTKRS